MNLQPFKYKDTAINDGTVFKATFPDQTFNSATPIWAETGASSGPELAGKTIEGGTISIIVTALQTPASNVQVIKAIFDQNDPELYDLEFKDADDSNRQWKVKATPLEVMPRGANVTIKLAMKEPYLHLSSPVTETTWEVTTPDDTKSVTVTKGNLSARLIAEFTPLVTPTSLYQHRAWVPVYNPSTEIAYPPPYALNLAQDGASSHVMDTAALVAAGKMLSTGYDLVAVMDGDIIPSWLHAMNTTGTKIWANSPGLSPSIEGSLETGIAATGDVDKIVITGVQNIAEFEDRETFLIYIGSELFIADNAKITYRKGIPALTFSDPERAQNETAEAAHTAGTTARLLEHEYWLYYGKADATQPDYRKSTNDAYAYRPMFELSSTAYSWVYSDFRDAQGLRSHKWRTVGANGSSYTGGSGTESSPVEVIGLYGRAANTSVFWQINHPAITAANFTNGEKRYLTLSDVAGAYVGGRIDALSQNNYWAKQYAIPKNSDLNWDTWSQNVTGLTAKGIRLGLFNNTANPLRYTAYVGAGDCTLGLDSDLVPVVRRGSEADVDYLLDAEFGIDETGEKIYLDALLRINDVVTVNCYDKTVKINGREKRSILRTNTHRSDWLNVPNDTVTFRYKEPTAVSMQIVLKIVGRQN